MQDSLHFQLFDEGHVFFADGVWNKHETLIVDLVADVVTYPVFIVQMKDSGIDWFYKGGAVRANGFKKMPKDRSVLFFTVFLAVSLAGHQGIFEWNVIVVNEIDLPFAFRAPIGSAGNRERDIFNLRYNNIFNHGLSGECLIS